MQLKTADGASIGAALTAASCALLGSAAPDRANAAEETSAWDVQTSTLYYGESDGRVQDFSVEALARKSIQEDRTLGLRLTVDALTGASPNGAVPSASAQTFTRPSGEGGYTAAPGELPLDDSFQDTRIATGVTWSQPLGRLLLLDVGFDASFEYDYQHLGVNANIAREFNRRNTTLSAGLAFASDTIDPVGGTPLAFATMPPPSDEDDEGRAAPLDEEAEGRAGSSESKTVIDALFGVTQVLGPHSILQLNYSLSDSSGYLTDPYKLLSVVDPVSGEPAPGGVGSNLYLYESRPDERAKNSLFALYKRDFGQHVLESAWRYMTDDWGIDSQTLDLRFRWGMGERRYLQPHVRYYTQSAADFYRTVLFEGEALPEFASADYRLSDFDAVTVGLKYGWPSAHGDWGVRLELYRQAGEASPGADVGVLRNLDIDPAMEAVIAQFSYRFRP